ncbi:hypothetical protein CHS0354_013228 [Potamilus streckersoni]|uniref:EF-hand domain-containing protein n=1 Tax=Potamilus streckersoni TaxID=2493646 RepID=A0AAE0SR80_9BIVA|nr:hypothetical protein CHS0354_013228 [Potamilus streckersoni]
MSSLLTPASLRVTKCPRRIQSVDKTKTISRASSRSRKSRAESTKSGPQDKSSESDSDNEEAQPQKDILLEPDFAGLDIQDDKAFDTDLEVEDAHENIKYLLSKDTVTTYDHSGKTAYIERCKRLGVVPASYFLRHIHDKELSMKHHGLGSDGMKAMAASLASNTHILSLDLSDNWLGLEGGLAVAEMLKENCFITALNLSDNRLGNDSAMALCKIIQQNTTLTHVTLSGNEFDDKAAAAFAEAIMNTTTVQYLDLSHNDFGEMAGLVLGPAISDNTCIKELDLSWNCFRRKGAVAIAQGIKSNVYMKKINLSWNGFGLEGALALQDALKGNSVLEELDIINNRITAEGAVLIGKGLSVNETLKVLKMGRNPMQSAGCYGICAAILRNPNCVIKELDFSDILVNNDFKDVLKQVSEQIPNLKVKHGGTELPSKPKARIHPMVKLANYIEKHNLRLIDFFNKFDKDGSMSVTHEEFVEGLEETGIKFTEEEIQMLLDELDKDGDGEISISELVVGHTDFQEKREHINTVLTVMQPRPITS